MSPLPGFEPTRSAALQRVATVRPTEYARTRNAIDGTVTRLSPYITHGFVALPEVLTAVAARHRVKVQDKFVYELGWREYFHHVWAHRGDGILQSLHEGPLPDSAYATDLPADIREARTGVPVIDMAVQSLYATGWLHNHARMWLASYVVHVRKVHWRAGADWLYGHLLDGDIASNHLSWQWVAGTGSSKPYLFNAENVARHAPAAWHSPGTVIDTSYEALDRMARQPANTRRRDSAQPPDDHATQEPPLLSSPPDGLGLTPPDASAVAGRDVWLVHPWQLGELPATLPADTVVIGVFSSDFHQAWPWSAPRWRFAADRMAALVPVRWWGDAATVGAALQGARRVRCIDEPHLAPWLARWATCEAAPCLFPTVERRCDSFSQWWNRATRGLDTAEDLLAVNNAPAW